MNNAMFILAVISMLFFTGTTCLILDMVYSKKVDVVYVKRETESKKSSLLDDEDLIINDDVTKSNIFKE